MTDQSPETTPITEDVKGYLATFWGWLDKPAEWFGKAVMYAPKISLLVAALLVLFAVF